MRRSGKPNPEFSSAALTRSRASRIAVSPRPTTEKAGSPGRMSTSTVTGLVSSPSIENVFTRASMAWTVGAIACRVTREMCQVCSDSAAGRRRGTEPCASWCDRVLRCHTSALTVAVMSSDLRHRLGRAGEDIALRHLERRGCALVARNHRTRFGEIDLIVHDARTSTLVFCEVKTRRAGPGSPWEALGEAKRAQVRRMALAYLAEVHDRPRADDLRFDAIGVVIDARGRLARLDHIEGAF